VGVLSFPFFPNLLKVLQSLLWQRIIHSKGDEIGGAILVQVRETSAVSGDRQIVAEALESGWCFEAFP